MARPNNHEGRKRRKHEQHSRGLPRLVNGWSIEGMYPSERPLGPGVVQAAPAEVISAIEKLPADLPWEAVAAKVVPLFERVRPYPPGMPALAQAIVPPGVAIGFGIDLGPAFMTVSADMIERWSLTVGDVCARSLANLHSIAAHVQPADVFAGSLGDVEAGWLQTRRGIGSVLALAPTELRRIFGPTARLFIAPMRDLLIGFPADVDRELAAWLFTEIASDDPNCLYPRAFLFDGREVTVEPLSAPRMVA